MTFPEKTLLAKKAMIGLIFCVSVISVGSFAQEGPKEQIEIVDDIEVVNQYCGTCHKVPPPYLMPKMFWPRAVRAMANLSEKRMGREFISEEIGTIISNYYVKNSPEHLPPLPYPSLIPASRVFEKHDVAKHSSLPLVVNAKPIDINLKSANELLVSDTEQNQIVLLSQVEGKWHETSLAKANVPVNTEIVDYDQDGDKDIIVAVLGDFPPSEKLVGEVILLTQLAPGKFKPSILLNNVGRITDARAVDLDGDKDLDIAVSIFGGGFIGELAWLENKGNGTHKKHTLLKLSGALNATPADINNDGKMDLVSLVAQEHEVIIAMINKGKRKFQPIRLGQAPHPMFGSTSMELVDMDNDNDLDLLFTNGDANDLQMDPKPYHGVQWSENKGNLKFTYHDIGRFYGASKAVAGDLDNDGDIDVVASSWHNYWEDPLRQSLIWFENNGKQQFTRHNITNKPRSIVSLELKDITGNQHLDIIAGVFRMDLMIEVIMAAKKEGNGQQQEIFRTSPLKEGVVIFENNKPPKQ